MMNRRISATGVPVEDRASTKAERRWHAAKVSQALLKVRILQVLDDGEALSCGQITDRIEDATRYKVDSALRALRAEMALEYQWTTLKRGGRLVKGRLYMKRRTR